MKWTKDAETRISKAPFFIRNIARKKAEEIAINKGKSIVEIHDVEIAKKNKDLKDLSKLDLSIKGIENSNLRDIALCASIKGCPLTLIDDKKAARVLDKVIREEELEDTMKIVLKEPILYHHKFKTAISGCPNSCSQPQIKDISIVGYSKPKVNKGSCVGCKQCVKSCPDRLISVGENPNIELGECIYCGRCIKECPTKSIEECESGYIVYIGGRLGRRPHLARKVIHVCDVEELEKILHKLVDWYKECILNGESFSRTVENCNIEKIQQRIKTS